jgi:cytoskeleton protein RodZ
MLDKFADELREKREQSGITLQQMANKTRIDLKFLEAIDEGNFAFLPELYVKAFIKQYAKSVGLDEAATIKRYEAARDGKLFEDINQSPESVEPAGQKPHYVPPVQTHTQQEKKPLKAYHDPSTEKKQADSDGSGKDRMMMFTVVAGVMVIILAVYFFFISDSKEIIIAERPFDEVLQESRQRYVEESADEPDGTESITTDSLYLKFYSSETSWIFVVLDNVKTEEFTLSPNIEHIVVAGNDFKATVGNSGGVKITLNNKPVEFSGRSGAVRHFKLDREGLQYLNTPPKIER